MQHHEVVIVGAGIAGLSCAIDACAAGLDVVVLEANDSVGGRIRTDHVDGFLLDHGFQLLNPAYPALHDFVDLEALHLRAFGAGVVVASQGSSHVLADPRRSWSDIRSALSSVTGGGLEKAKFAAYVAEAALRSPASIKARADIPYGTAWDHAGVNGRLRTTVLEPFLAGVLGEDEQQSSRVFVDLLLRTFARGSPSVPALGMQMLPAQLAERLLPGVVRVGMRVTSVREAMVSTEDGQDFGARAVVVAADPATASDLLGLPGPTMRALTTIYHKAMNSPATRPLLHLDGDRTGPVVNSAVISDVAPAYAENGALIASTVLGAHDDAETLAAVMRQLTGIYGTATDDWEHVATYAIENALVAMPPGVDFRQPVDLGGGMFVCGDHRDTASIQGAIVSGRRTAQAVTRSLARPTPSR